MPGPEFFQTRMGKAFYEGTMPRVAKALERIADVMEKRLLRDENEERNAVAVQALIDANNLAKENVSPIEERRRAGKCMHGVMIGEVCEACEE